MKTIKLLFCLLLFVNLTVLAQLKINTGATMTGGSAQIALSGNWNNEGTFTAGTSTVIFNAVSGTQTITKSGGETFNNLTVNKTAGDLSLGNNVLVNGTLTLTSGDLVTGSNTVSFGTSAANPSESSAGFINGNATMNQRSVGTGTLNYLSANLTGDTEIGNVTITRVTGSSGDVTVGDNSSISSNWDITAGGTTPYANRTLTLSWLSDLDNGKTFSSGNKAQIWTSTDGGSSWFTTGVASDVSGSDPRTIGSTVTSFSKWTVSDEDSPLPVELSSFTANVIDNKVILNWTTETEVTNYGFDIERTESSPDPYNEHWTVLGFVEGHGNSSSPKHYEFIDKNPLAKKLTYRLKQIELDGSYEYLSIIAEVDAGILAPEEYSLSQNYPNPFNPSTTIKYGLAAVSDVRLEFYNIIGEQVHAIERSNLAPGHYSHTFNVVNNNLSSGIILYRIVIKNLEGDEQFVDSKSMILLK
ncbi:hypothetical protein ACFLSH_01520 [Bacteroidota bacterium]